MTKKKTSNVIIFCILCLLVVFNTYFLRADQLL